VAKDTLLNSYSTEVQIYILNYTMDVSKMKVRSSFPAKNTLTNRVHAHSFQVAEIKKELKDRGLNQAGNKQELVTRLQEAIEAEVIGQGWC
jgi:hypothetical protein